MSTLAFASHDKIVALAEWVANFVLMTVSRAQAIHAARHWPLMRSEVAVTKFHLL